MGSNTSSVLSTWFRVRSLGGCGVWVAACSAAAWVLAEEERVDGPFVFVDSLLLLLLVEIGVGVGVRVSKSNDDDDDALLAVQKEVGASVGVHGVLELLPLPAAIKLTWLVVEVTFRLMLRLFTDDLASISFRMYSRTRVGIISTMGERMSMAIVLDFSSGTLRATSITSRRPWSCKD